MFKPKLKNVLAIMFYIFLIAKISKKYNLLLIFLLLIIFIFRGYIYAKDEFCQFPSLDRLKTLNALTGSIKDNYLIIGKVIKIRRMPLSWQNPKNMVEAHYWHFFPFYAEVQVNDIIKGKGGAIKNITKDENIYISIDTSIAWGSEYRWKYFSIKGPSLIKYLKIGEEYLFCLYINGISKKVYMYELYTPRAEIIYANVRSRRPFNCDNFYVWPMHIEGNMIEVPVQFYGSNEIIRKKFKYEEIVNLYRNRK